MAQKIDVRYVQLYTDGTAAKKMQQVSQSAKVVKHTPKKQKKIVICIDPLAIAGIFVAGLMLILMLVGVSRLHTARQAAVQMDAYVQILQAQNEELEKTYSEKVDLDKVREMALAIGMVPKEQVKTSTITIDLPHTEEQTVWTRIGTFLAGLFA